MGLGEFEGPVHCFGEGFGGDVFYEEDSVFFFVVEDGFGGVGFVEAALDDVSEAFKGESDAGDGVEGWFVLFVVVDAEVYAVAVAYGFEDLPGFGEGGFDAGEVGVDEGVVFGFSGGMEVCCHVAEFHMDFMNVVAGFFVGFTGEGFEDFFREFFPLVEGWDLGVGYNVAFGFVLGKGLVVKRLVAVCNSHSSAEGERFVPCKSLYELLHVHYN